MFVRMCPLYSGQLTVLIQYKMKCQICNNEPNIGYFMIYARNYDQVMMFEVDKILDRCHKTSFYSVWNLGK